MALSRPLKEDCLVLSKYHCNVKKEKEKKSARDVFKNSDQKRLSLGVRRFKRNKLTHVMNVLFSVCKWAEPFG